MVRRGAERRFYDIMLYPLAADDAGGGAVARIEDVTERARIQELMIQTEKMMSVGGLAAGAAVRARRVTSVRISSRSSFIAAP